MEAQRAVTDMTNELLQEKRGEAQAWPPSNAAKEAERGIVDIETLQQTNQMLIDTHGRGAQPSRRKAARSAMPPNRSWQRIEGELKAKLLEIAR